MKRILITGFAPFDGKAVNSSWAAVQALPRHIQGTEFYKMEIPTVFGQAARLVLEKAKQVQADAVICVGVAAGRDAVTTERIAVNIRDARIPDNDGNQPQGEFIAPEGPAAYFTTLPAEKIAQAIRDAGIPSCVSNSAGTYVCNDVFYTLLHTFHDTPVRVGFIHVPQLPEQGAPSMQLEKITEALKIAIESI